MVAKVSKNIDCPAAYYPSSEICFLQDITYKTAISNWDNWWIHLMLRIIVLYAICGWSSDSQNNVLTHMQHVNQTDCTAAEKECYRAIRLRTPLGHNLA